MKLLMRNLVCLSIFCVISGLYSATITQYDKASEYLDRKGEVYFRSDFATEEEARNMASDFVVDYCDASFIYLYADRESFEAFIRLNKWYEVLEHPGDYPEVVAARGEENVPQPGNISLPSSGAPYSGYEAMINGLESDYPDIMKVTELGASTTGKKIYSIKCSNDPSIDQAKPLFIGTSTMHGDEPTGMMMILYVLEWLGENYGSDPQATAIVDNTEMYFIPLVNPSGSYNNNGDYGNQVRRSPNCKDINRSFPTPEFGNEDTQYPSGDNERDVVEAIYEDHSFSMGYDLHTGMTSVVLPWSCTGTQSYEHPDFEGSLKNIANNFISRVGGMSGGTGWAYTKWYPGYGTIFDYSVYFGHCRCFCIELGSKQVDQGDITSAWSKFKPGFLYIMEEIQFGIHGIIYSEGVPVKAKVTVDDWDKYESEMYSDATTGYYARPIEAGTYDLTITYETYTIEVPNVTVKDGEKTDIGFIEMSGTNVSQKTNALAQNPITVTPCNRGLRINFGSSANNATVSIFTTTGRSVRTLTCGPNSRQNILWDRKDSFGRDISNGCYIAKVRNNNKTVTTSFMVSQ